MIFRECDACGNSRFHALQDEKGNISLLCEKCEKLYPLCCFPVNDQNTDFLTLEEAAKLLWKKYECEIGPRGRISMIMRAKYKIIVGIRHKGLYPQCKVDFWHGYPVVWEVRKTPRIGG